MRLSAPLPWGAGLLYHEEGALKNGTIKRKIMSKNITKADLVASAAEASGLTKSASEEVINQLLSTVEKALKKGRSVTLVGFGSFSVGTRQARKGRNPQTKKEIKIPATKVAKFKPGKTLK